MRLIPNSSFDRVGLAAFVIGIAFVMIGFYFEEYESIALKIGGTLWVTAYFTVVLENWKARRPVHTRGGTEIRYEEHKWMYLANFAFVSLFGAIGAIVVLASWAIELGACR